jgi:hypothetical protein
MPPLAGRDPSSDCLAPGQRRDPVTGEVQPFYTPLTLDEIQNWAVQNMTILEWGGGYSTLWWAKRCRQIFTIETSSDWCEWILARATAADIRNLTVMHRPMSTPIEQFTKLPPGCAPDIVIIDGAARLECLIKSLTLPRPLTIIFDNWQQDNAFMSPEAEALMKPFVGISYPELHPAHKKHPWQTAIWDLA